MTVRRIDPISLGRITGIIYAILGLIIALPAGCMAATFGTMAGDAGLFMGGAGLFIIILYPILLGIMGLIGGLLTAVIYNFVAGRFGGVELEVDVAPAGSTGYGYAGESPAMPA